MLKLLPALTFRVTMVTMHLCLSLPDSSPNKKGRHKHTVRIRPHCAKTKMNVQNRFTENISDSQQQRRLWSHVRFYDSKCFM